MTKDEKEFYPLFKILQEERGIDELQGEEKTQAKSKLTDEVLKYAPDQNVLDITCLEECIKATHPGKLEEFKEKAEKVQEEHKFDEASAIFEKLRQAGDFVKVQPLFYDRTKIWWLWNFNKFCYEKVDEIDVLNAVSKSIGLDTTTSKTRTEILNALQQVGRNHMPRDIKESWVQFKDKIVDVKTGKIIKATPSYFVTNPIPHSIGQSEKTPVIDRLMREWTVMKGLQDESYIRTLLEIVAYSCLQNQFLQRIFALTGIGSNGKGCFTKLLKKFLGEDNVGTTELKLLTTKQFESTALYKKQACFIQEVDSYDMQNTRLLKKLSGEDDIRYEFKGKTPFSEHSVTTVIISTNSLPITPDQSLAYYRRWLIVDFPYIFKVGRDVVSEIPDIEFNNLAKKCIRICKGLYAEKKFTNEGNFEEREERYEARSNPLMKFIEAELTEDNPDSYLIFKEFYDSFLDFLKKNRLRRMSKVKVSKALRSEGFQVKGRHATDLDGNETHTTCVYGLERKSENHIQKTLEATQSHSNSKSAPYVESELKKECLSVALDGGHIGKRPEILAEEVIDEPKGCRTEEVLNAIRANKKCSSAKIRKSVNISEAELNEALHYLKELGQIWEPIIDKYMVLE